MVQYKIVSSVGHDKIGYETIINDHILVGWYPFGGVCVHNDNFFQVMMKYDYAEKPTRDTNFDPIKETEK